MNFEYLSVPEIMEKIGLKNRIYFNENYINPALKLGIKIIRGVIEGISYSHAGFCPDSQTRWFDDAKIGIILECSK